MTMVMVTTMLVMLMMLMMIMMTTTMMMIIVIIIIMLIMILGGPTADLGRHCVPAAPLRSRGPTAHLRPRRVLRPRPQQFGVA